MGDDLVARLKVARETAAALVGDSLALLAAARATVDESTRLVAHAVPDIGELTATKGVSLCDLLAGDEVVVVPDLHWDDVARDQQCDVCARSARVLSRA